MHFYSPLIWIQSYPVKTYYDAAGLLFCKCSLDTRRAKTNIKAYTLEGIETTHTHTHSHSFLLARWGVCGAGRRVTKGQIQQKKEERRDKKGGNARVVMWKGGYEEAAARLLWSSGAQRSGVTGEADKVEGSGRTVLNNPGESLWSSRGKLSH